MSHLSTKQLTNTEQYAYRQTATKFCLYLRHYLTINPLADMTYARTGMNVYICVFVSFVVRLFL